ncbi:MAG: ATP-binding protein [Candidatus Velthaea sp.]
MLDPATLRGRLTLVYASALALAIVFFAAGTLLFLDHTQKRILDQRLTDAGHAMSAVVLDETAGRVVLDERDRHQFSEIVGVSLDAGVVFNDGRVVASTASKVPASILAAVREANPIQRLITVGVGEDRLRVRIIPFGKAGPNGAVVVWRDIEPITNLDRRAALAFGVAIPVLVLFVVLGAGAVAARGLRPLETMAALASEIEAHDLTQRLNFPSKPRELGRLGATFDRMLERLQAAFTRERTFTSDASHELRAPLAVIRAEADLALRRERSPDEYRRALQAIADEADALEALTRDLLHVARNDQAGSAADESVDLTGVAGRIVERLDVLARAKKITTTYCPGPALTVHDNALDIERAAIAIVHNAIKYAPEGGHVDVYVERDNGRAVLRVRDDGAGFSQTALAHALERFWRDDTSRGGEGTGLGLPIAQALIRRSGGMLRLGNAPEHGGEVVVSFPGDMPR